MKLLSVISSSWFQLGPRITIPSGNYQSVSLNQLGDKVAIGVRTSKSAAIYSWDGSSWSQLGSTIVESGTSTFGSSISLNSDGDRVAICDSVNNITKIYSWDGSSWFQLGSTIVGAGSGVSLNSLGNRVAIINSVSDGTLKIYSWNGSSWSQLGLTIVGASDDNGFYTVSLNSIGDIVAIGGFESNLNKGIVKIYSWNGSSWSQLGSSIIGAVSGDNIGNSVSLNSAGDRVAVGASEFSSTGAVYIYSWDGSSWSQLGSTIVGGVGNTRFGYSVSLNSAGDRVAVGANFGDNNNVKIYSWNGSSWSQLGSTIKRGVSDDIGNSVSLNSAGDRVAVGTNYSNSMVFQYLE